MNISSFVYTYDPTGEISTLAKQWDQGGSLPSAFSYDSTSQLVMAACPNPTTFAGQSFFYSYDATGNRTQEQVDATINTSSYNSTNENLAKNGGGSMTFAGTVSEPAAVTVGGNSATVDSFNDWMGASNVNLGANVVPNSATDSSGNTTNKSINVAVSGGPSRTLIYDSNGNLLSNGAGQTYLWDAENRLVSITQASGTTGFIYDGAGHRVQETHNGTVIKQLVWCGSQPCEQLDGSGNMTARFFAQGEQIGGSSYFYTRDHLGSVREMTDATGAIRTRYDYDPYGRVTKMSGDLDADFGFTGDYFHAASGLSLTLYRAYDPNLGRWLSRDPLGENAGINVFAYVGNNPINNFDPLGLWSFEIYGGSIVGGYLKVGNNSGHFSYTVGVGLGEGIAASYDPTNTVPDPADLAPGTYTKGILAKLDASVLGTGLGVSAGLTKTIDGCGHRTKTVDEASLSGSVAGFQKTFTADETYLPGSDDPDISTTISDLQGTKPDLPKTLSKIKIQLGGFVGATYGKP